MKMHLLFYAVFISLITDEHCVNAQDEDTNQARNRRQVNAHFYGTTLKWVKFESSIPDGAESFWNGYSERREYPCRVRNCAAGYYSPSRGPYCYYPYGDREQGISPFWVLVNEYNFESLKWEEGSYGSVPRNSISTCPGVEIYVGKNRYGLGKVDVRNTAFFLGYGGKEYWYKTYDVLTINKNYRSQEINRVRYNTKQGTYSSHALTLFTTKLNNNNCNSVKKTTTLSKTVSFEHQWDVGISLSESVSTTIRAQVPLVAEGSWSFSSEKSYSWNERVTNTELITYTETVEVDIPPNHSCEVAMEGVTYRASIPFTARVTRYYHNGESRSATVPGVSNNVAVVQVHINYKQCQPIPNARSCSS